MTSGQVVTLMEERCSVCLCHREAAPGCGCIPHSGERGDCEEITVKGKQFIISVANVQLRRSYMVSQLRRRAGRLAGWLGNDAASSPPSLAGGCSTTVPDDVKLGVNAQGRQNTSFSRRGDGEMRTGCLGRREGGSEDRDEMDDMCKDA